MTMPGTWLRAFAARSCDAELMARVIDPLIADLQFEWDEAITGGRAIRAWGIRLKATVAFWQVMAWRALFVHRTSPDQMSAGRFAAVSAAFVAVTACLLDAVAFVRVGQLADEPQSLWLLVDLAPRALALALPAGLVAAIAWPRRAGRRGVSTRDVLWLAFAASMMCFALMAWIMPETSRAFRAAGVGAIVSGPLMEMTLAQMWQFLHTSQPPMDAATVWTNFHLRWAMSASPLALAWLLTAIASSTSRHRVIGIALAVAGPVGYLALLGQSARLGFAGVISPAAAAWAPNVILFATALALALSVRRRTPMSAGPEVA